MQTASCDILDARTFFSGTAAGGDAHPDYALAQAAADGIAAAVGDLYERYSRRVYSLCFRMTHSAEDAEDLTHEVFIHLFRKAGSFRGESQFTTWLHRVTINQVLMHLRRPVVRKERVGEEDDIEAELANSQQGKHSVAPQDVERLALDAALAQLPAGYRAVFVLFDIEGYSHGEIAVLLGFSEGTSKSQLHKARLRLRRLLKTSSFKQNVEAGEDCLRGNGRRPARIYARP